MRSILTHGPARKETYAVDLAEMCKAALAELLADIRSALDHIFRAGQHPIVVPGTGHGHISLFQTVD